MKKLLAIIPLVLLLPPGLFAASSRVEGLQNPNETALPAFPKPGFPALPANAPALQSGNLELRHASNALGAFVVRVSGRQMAIGQNHPFVAYLHGADVRWVDLGSAPGRKFQLRARPNSLVAGFECADPDGARWQINQTFAPGQVRGSIDIRTEVTVSQERAVAFLPMITLFPGVGDFGSEKGQGLLAGLEYLENEPSSSEADLVGPASRRQVPDTLKLTFPLMAVQAGGKYVALTWQMRPQFCALYDSPDRLFGSGGHVMGVLFPGSNGTDRREGSLLPKSPQTLRAGETLELRATVLGGEGESVIPAVQQYVALRPLPSIPAPGLDLQGYVRQTAGGWLDSGIRQSNLFRHAIAGGNFQPQRAADAAMWMDWLALRTSDEALAGRLREVARAALAVIPENELYSSGIGHIRFPAPPLWYGHLAENAEQAAQIARSLLTRFEPDFSVQYRPQAGGPDLSKTHFSKEANGLTSRTVMDLLDAAAFAGDPDLLAAALQRLRAMDKFRNGVPRGAQTWECPLHTPDILASAQMVRAYTVGYELTGDAALLEQARYWAWTGVPFVYLVNPTSRPVGLYGTIAVFGATQWKAPVWLGLPVQWCGLVYADALYRLAEQDAKGPWKKLADGITASGIQQSWPATDTEKQGLLPDSFVLRTQHRNGPAINPATVQACATRYFGQTPVFDWCQFRTSGARVFAPGKIENRKDSAGAMSFQIRPAVNHPYFVLINGLTHKPRVTVDGHEAGDSAVTQFVEKSGRLILRLEGSAAVKLLF